MSMPLVGRDLWVKRTAKDGSSYVSHHRVWNADLFLKTEGAEAAKQGGKVEMAHPPEKR